MEKILTELNAERIGEFDFNVTDSDKEKYETLIISFRSSDRGVTDAALGGKFPQHNLKTLLRSAKEIKRLKFFDIRFDATTHRGELKSVWVRFQASNLYLIAFRGSSSDWMELNMWWTDTKIKIKGLRMTKLPADVTVNYDSLGDRNNVSLGKGALEGAVFSLSKYKLGDKTGNIKVPLMVIAQMFSEAVRLPSNFEKIGEGYVMGVQLGEDLVELQNNYGKWCRQISQNIFQEMIIDGFEMHEDEYQKVSVLLWEDDLDYEKEETIHIFEWCSIVLLHFNPYLCDTVLSINSNDAIPKSDVNREYFAEKHDCSISDKYNSLGFFEAKKNEPSAAQCTCRFMMELLASIGCYFRSPLRTIWLWISLALVLQFSKTVLSDSNYLIGLGRYDITGPAADVNMMGYAYIEQIASGIHFRLQARTFIVAEPQGKRVVFVNLDACMASQLVTIKVLERLKAGSRLTQHVMHGDLPFDFNI
ncbi:hypothetical protein PTKIN_Ptkin03bG0045100 [Pterospermum kingtungense]